MALLEVSQLVTSFFTEYGEAKAVRGVSFTLEKGEVLGIVGESGSGKSVTVYSVLRILPGNGKILSGSIKFRETELTRLSEAEMEKIRGNKISIIFQDPMTSLNPTHTVGSQLTEVILLHTQRSRKEAAERAEELLKLVGINAPRERLKQYPFELSGGMRQRVMIAMALACEPDILIADEPTTALDVTVQAEILKLMRELQKKLGMAIILITHDLGVVAELCDKVTVMYAGTVCESGSVSDIFENPSHEYTKGLLRSMPSEADADGRLRSINGSPVNLLNLPMGCPFSPRCDEAMKICISENAPVMTISEGHTARCWFNEKMKLCKALGGEALE